MTLALGRKLPAWHVPAALLGVAASLGDVLRHIPGCRTPFDSEVFQRLTGSACYQAGNSRKELQWRPRSWLYEALPDMVAAYRHPSLLTLP